MQTVKFQRPDGKDLGIELIRLLPHESIRNVTPDRHRHEFHTLFFVQEGISRQEVDFQVYNIAKNQILFIPHGAIHWEIQTENLAGYVLLFTDNFLAPAMHNLLKPFIFNATLQRKVVLQLSEKQAVEFENLAKIIAQEQANDEINQVFILQNLLLVWINKMDSILQTQQNQLIINETRKIFQDFVVLLESHFLAHHEVDFYAEKLPCTAKKLSQLLVEITGKTTQELLIERILNEAKRQIAFTSLTIKEIAYGLGYENSFYFSRIFKKKEGISPEEFRKQFEV